MALYIADPKTAEMAEELSRLWGTSKTDAVRRALREELAREKRKATVEERLESMQAVIRETSALLKGIRYNRKEADDWLYDETGVPH
jgi:antitoxin VapB